MRTTVSRLGQTFGVLIAGSSLAAVTPLAASASTPVGTCTSSYSAYTFAGLAAADPGLTQQVFDAVNKNGDVLICFKPYPNGPHDGHLGNLIDNTSAPHP